MSAATVVVKCPFLNRTSKNFLQHAGSSLKSYADRCPVMKEVTACPVRAKSTVAGKENI